LSAGGVELDGQTVKDGVANLGPNKRAVGEPVGGVKKLSYSVSQMLILPN
jgi:hypothetical protein